VPYGAAGAYRNTQPSGPYMGDGTGDYRSKRKELFAVLSQMEVDRESFTQHWRDIQDHIRPRAGRFEITDVNRGEKRYNQILDNTGSVASRVLSSGMHAAMSSPAQPWYRLGTPYPELNDDWEVRFWLDTVTDRMRSAMQRSNLYQSLPSLYQDAGDFATGAMLVEKDLENVAWTRVLPIGSYMVANDPKGRVNTFAREFTMTIRQVLEEFGERDADGEITNWENFSLHVKAQYARKHFEHRIDVCHVIAPNPEHDPGAIEAKYKRFLSCYFERSANAGDRTLRDSGYDLFPVIVARWRVTGEDSYGTDCPGMMALGDIRQLQQTEKVALQALEKQVNPPLVGGSGLRGVTVSTIPGHLTLEDAIEGRKGLRPIYEVMPQTGPVEAKQQQVRERINRAYFVDVFQMLLAMQDRKLITAREIDAREGERLLAMGPVLEQFNQDVHDPLIDLYFAYMLEDGLIPPPPPILEGVTLRVEYISILAQAQKLAGLGAVDRFGASVANMLAYTQNPEILDNMDPDAQVRLYAEMTGVPARILRSEDAVKALRDARARANQAAAMMQNIQAAGAAAKDLAAAKTDEPNALTALLGQTRAGALTRAA